MPNLTFVPLAAALLVTAMGANGQAPVRFIPASRLFILDTANTTYAIGINEKAGLQNLYWGKKLTREQDLPPAHTPPGYAFESPEGITAEEYPGWGGMRYSEPCLKVTIANGTRDLVLKYVSHEVNGASARYPC